MKNKFLFQFMISREGGKGLGNLKHLFLDSSFLQADMGLPLPSCCL
jgi:hypothetical protein